MLESFPLKPRNTFLNQPMKQLILTCLLALSVSLNAAPAISKRASEIDPRAKEHPEIDS